MPNRHDHDQIQSGSQVTYAGDMDSLSSSTDSRRQRRRFPWAFASVVVAPTALGAFYYFLIASPIYVSEGRFIVRSSNQAQPSSLGVALQGVGLSSTQTDAFAVHEYIRSRDGVAELSKVVDVDGFLSRRGADFISRYPSPWEERTKEGTFEAFQRFVTVGYDSTTGISTIRVRAFNPQDARAAATQLLVGGEGLVNRLNARAGTDAVANAVDAQAQARDRLTSAQTQLSAFRNREQIIDPQREALAGGDLIGELLVSLANLRAERSQLSEEAPNSPQLPSLDRRIAAFEGQVSEERRRIAGNNSSLSGKISEYESLVLERELAERELSAASIALNTAQLDSTRKKLYLERVVNPNLPDEPSLPKRWLRLLTIFASCLITYGVGWLVWAGVREHGQS